MQTLVYDLTPTESKSHKYGSAMYIFIMCHIILMHAKNVEVSFIYLSSIGFFKSCIHFPYSITGIFLSFQDQI